jgi:hypothetical protein
MKNVVFCDVTPCGSCKNRLLEELSASIIRVTRIGEQLSASKTSVLTRATRRNIPENGFHLAFSSFWNSRQWLKPRTPVILNILLRGGRNFRFVYAIKVPYDSV